MRTTSGKKRAATPAGAGVRRVVVDFPSPLLDQAERVLPQLSINRSELIRKAVEQFLEALQRAQLEREMAEGYIANGAQARAACEELAYVDHEVI